MPINKSKRLRREGAKELRTGSFDRFYHLVLDVAQNAGPHMCEDSNQVFAEMEMALAAYLVKWSATPDDMKKYIEWHGRDFPVLVELVKVHNFDFDKVLADMAAREKQVNTGVS